MAFSNIDNLSGSLGKFLGISFSEALYTQISDDFRDWEMIKRARVDMPQGREHRFRLLTSFGPASTQYRNPNGSANFPRGQKILSSEHSAVYKELDQTIVIDYNLWHRLEKSGLPEDIELLSNELNSKMYAGKRRRAADLYGDGTGVIGTVSANTDTTGANGYVTVTLASANSSRGHVGFFEYGDLLLAKQNDGTARTPTVAGGTFYAYRVDRKDRKNNQVRLSPVTNANANLSLTSSGLASTDYFIRVGQPSSVDFTGSISDYGTITEVVAGLESLTANDGRVIHGITMAGSTAGSVFDGNGDPLDISMIQAGMDEVKINVGRNHKWKKLCMAPESHAKFVESRETDRRFISKDDAVRGIKVFGFQHEDDFLESYTSEYVPRKRIYALPEDNQGNKVLEFHGTDFETVSVGNMSEFQLSPASSPAASDGPHAREVVSYLEALGVLICTKPQAILRIENFV